MCLQQLSLISKAICTAPRLGVCNNPSASVKETQQKQKDPWDLAGTLQIGFRDSETKRGNDPIRGYCFVIAVRSSGVRRNKLRRTMAPEPEKGGEAL